MLFVCLKPESRREPQYKQRRNKTYRYKILVYLFLNLHDVCYMFDELRGDSPCENPNHRFHFANGFFRLRWLISLRLGLLRGAPFMFIKANGWRPDFLTNCYLSDVGNECWSTLSACHWQECVMALCLKREPDKYSRLTPGRRSDLIHVLFIFYLTSVHLRLNSGLGNWQYAFRLQEVMLVVVSKRVAARMLTNLSPDRMTRWTPALHES